RFPDLTIPVVDKHSTGGVGDKTSLILAPMVASAGVAVPMISGRGLGHTGGTVDKLESIPGFRTDLSLREAEAQVHRLGCAMIGQTGEIAPADKKIYGLRDVTATIDSIPLIAASIMSKKLAEGLNGLVLDVKTGAGAFMPDVPKSIELAQTMIAIGQAHDCPTVALLTTMDHPLGWAAGNALEVEECIRAMRGDGPVDLMEVTYALGVAMLQVGGVEQDPAAARKLLEAAIHSGRAAELFTKIIEAQGGNPAVVENPSLLPRASVQRVFEAPEDGVVRRVEPRSIGRGIAALGGGRFAMDDVLDPGVGFVFSAKPGVEVERGQPLATVHARNDEDLEIGFEVLRSAITIGEPPPHVPLISHRITARGVDPWTGSVP
ncbi:MAG: thymidine phosphorylase, partial [Gemmatimonadales bacterium]|nr:thymidine phosphorylase [Gemmatimonadales bacterium]